MDSADEMLLEKLKSDGFSPTKEEMDRLLEIFREDMDGELKCVSELGYFHYLASTYPDAYYSHEIQNVRQNYIHHLRKQRSSNVRKLNVLHIHSAEYYYSIQVYSECVRNVFAVLENKSSDIRIVSVATSILLSMLTKNNLFSKCFPYVESLKKTMAEVDNAPTTVYIQEMAFLYIYGMAGDRKTADEYYEKLRNMKPLPEGIGPAELACLELLHLCTEAAADLGTEPEEGYVEKLFEVCSDMRVDCNLRDSDYSGTLIPILRYILPYISSEQLMKLYQKFDNFVYSPFDFLELYSFLFEEAGKDPEFAPKLYERYVEMLKEYYKVDQKNRKLVIENEILAQSMESEYRRKALTDRLTKLGNRQAYTELFQQCADSSEPLEPSLCLVMMDLDNLKKQNDTFGHEAGDQLICGAAESIIAAFGENAHLFRYGGDEFVAVFTSDEDDVRRKLQRLEDECRSWTLGEKNNFRAELSISAGYAFGSETPGDMDNAVRLREICELADNRMYIEKKKHHLFAKV